jgi:putative ABC transport system permease protein
MTRDEFKGSIAAEIDSMLNLIYVLLFMALAIALFGIANTLALSVYERTRELGLLRAVGMTRSQVRAMVRWESVVISLIGALSGAVLGIGIGLAGAQALQFWGVNSLAVPTTQVALYVVLAAIAGVLAALGPARTASKVDVLKAVVTD